MSDCLFCNIIARTIPADIVYENEHLLAFKDINPKAPIHLLIVPKKHYPTLNDIPDEEMEIVGEVHKAVKMLARQFDVAESGYRTLVNTNKEGGQVVFHVHYHLIGGRQLRG
ncbi:MAG: histidine triad nucleotide-binding protein [Deltaproteobacteria bacterium]|nr:histidine triad nucleotide-binding protein [Candidatus Anaeroferrophillus wilburensis]MBN2888810.1 histidine triad nucleotide-binding protein [Deltaproteobacteria bacterium]